MMKTKLATNHEPRREITRSLYGFIRIDELPRINTFALTKERIKQPRLNKSDKIANELSHIPQNEINSCKPRENKVNYRNIIIILELESKYKIYNNK